MGEGGEDGEEAENERLRRGLSENVLATSSVAITETIAVPTIVPPMFGDPLRTATVPTKAAT